MAKSSYSKALDVICDFLKQAQEEPLQTDEEYDAGGHEEPEKEEFLAKSKETLEDANLAVPSEEASEGKAETAQESLDESYSEDVGASVPEEKQPEDLAETTGPKGGEEAEKDLEEKVGSLSDTQLIAEYNKVLNQLLREKKSDTQVKTAFAEAVAHIVKTAEFDADLVGGFILGRTLKNYDQNTLAQLLKQQEAAISGKFMKAAQEALEEIAEEEEGDRASDESDEEEDEGKEEKEVTVEKEDVVDAVTDVLTNVPDLVTSLGGDPNDFKDPEEVKELVGEVVEENPGLTSAVAKVLEDAVSQANVPLKEESKAARWRKKKAQTLSIDTNQLMQAVQNLAQNPEVMNALNQLTEEVVGAVPSEESKEESTKETEEEEETSEEVPEKEKPAEEEPSAAAQLAALSEEAASQGLSPEEIAEAAQGGPKEEEAKKVAAALKRFRQMKISKNPAAKRAARNPVLRERMRNYLNELIFGM